MSRHITISAPYLKADFTPRFMSKKAEIKLRVANEVHSTKCSECGKPALRRFYNPKVGHYGRCKAHLSGGTVPFSYKKVV